LCSRISALFVAAQRQMLRTEGPLAVPELNGTFSSSPTVARLFQTAA
jgi:hypothetical protein